MNSPTRASAFTVAERIEISSFARVTEIYRPTPSFQNARISK